MYFSDVWSNSQGGSCHVTHSTSSERCVSARADTQTGLPATIKAVPLIDPHNTRERGWQARSWLVGDLRDMTHRFYSPARTYKQVVMDDFLVVKTPYPALVSGEVGRDRGRFFGIRRVEKPPLPLWPCISGLETSYLNLVAMEAGLSGIVTGLHLVLYRPC